MRLQARPVVLTCSHIEPVGDLHSMTSRLPTGCGEEPHVSITVASANAHPSRCQHSATSRGSREVVCFSIGDACWMGPLADDKFMPSGHSLFGLAAYARACLWHEIQHWRLPAQFPLVSNQIHHHHAGTRTSLELRRVSKGMSCRYVPIFKTSIYSRMEGQERTHG